MNLHVGGALPASSSCASFRDLYVCLRKTEKKSARSVNQPMICLDRVARTSDQISALPAGVVTTLLIPGSAQNLNGFLLDEPVVLKMKKRTSRVDLRGKEAKKLEKTFTKS